MLAMTITRKTPVVSADTAVSAVVLLPEDLSLDSAGIAACVQNIAEQDYPLAEVIIVDGRGREAELPLLARSDENRPPMIHLPGDYANRAAMFNAGMAEAGGAFVLLVCFQNDAISLKSSALQTMLMAAARQSASGRAPAIVYADYERIDTGGQRSDVHLLDWHEGRLRETFDTGPVWLVCKDALTKVGGFDESLHASDRYDVRLKLSTCGPLAHIANRYAGSLYAVSAPGKTHNVFDYLLASPEAQREFEQVASDHLKRIGAFLEPGDHYHEVVYSAQEEQSFEDCIASVVIPVNNRPQFISAAIQSVQAQTEQRVEVIVVVNGGPDDPTIPAVKSWMPDGEKHRPDVPPVRLIVVDVNNLGLCLNTGISAARGKFYVQLDSDDRLKPDAIEKLLTAFGSDPRIGMVIGSYDVWTQNEKTGRVHRNKEVPVVTHPEWTEENGRNNLLRINGAGAPRSAHIKVIKDVGWFGVNDTAHCRNYGEDYDLVLRICEKYAIGRVWDPIYEVIRHAGGTDHAIDPATVDRNDNAKDQMRLEAIARRQQMNRHKTTSSDKVNA